MVPKPDKTVMRKLEINISYEIDKIPEELLANQMSNEVFVLFQNICKSSVGMHNYMSKVWSQTGK